MLNHLEVEETLDVVAGLGFMLRVTPDDCCAPPSCASSGPSGGGGGLREAVPPPPPPPPVPAAPLYYQGGQTTDRPLLEPHRWVNPGLHHLTMTGSDAAREAAGHVLRRRFGMAQQLMPRGFYAKGKEWLDGSVQLLWEHNNADSCCVLVRGAVFDTLPLEEHAALLHELQAVGLKATRIDVKVDLEGSSVHLVEHVQDACRRGELTGARTWQPHDAFDHLGRPTSLGVTIGKRGKLGSGRYIRCYDKGLEQDDAPNCIHRWEVEFTGDCAVTVARTLVTAARSGGGTQAFVSALLGRAFGAVAFTVGDRDRALAERQVAAWWARLLQNVRAVRTVALRPASTFVGRLRWMTCQVLPTLEAWRHWMGGSLDDVAHFMTERAEQLHLATRAGFDEATARARRRLDVFALEQGAF